MPRLLEACGIYRLRGDSEEVEGRAPGGHPRAKCAGRAALCRDCAISGTPPPTAVLAVESGVLPACPEGGGRRAHSRPLVKAQLFL